VSDQRPSNQNTGHGHVRPRPDGVRARCGGPGMCAECSRELAREKLGKPPGEQESLTSKTLLDRLEKATCDGDLYMGTRDLFQDAIDEIERLQWVYTSSALPEKGRKVLFELSGDPGKPIIGYFDDKGSWKERTGKEYATDWDCWWTDLHDEDDWWEHKHVTRWCYVPEMP
jgi:hypothetical protein